MKKEVLILVFGLFLIGLVSSQADNIKLVNDRWIDPSTLKDFGGTASGIMNAQTNQEKALALFRFIQQTTMVIGKVPAEPAYGDDYVDNGEKLINVYGAHWCDGLSRIMQMVWRAMDYRANKLYKFGHTLASIHYEDEDGIERWHVFDNSAYHWFVYDRTGTHIATPEELILDSSLEYFPFTGKCAGVSEPVPSYLIERHIPFLDYTSKFNLRNNEKVTFLWGNLGKPYYDPVGSDVGGYDFEHGPYRKTYGNAIWEYSPDFTDLSYQDGSEEQINILSIAQDSISPNIHPSQVGTPASILFKFESPYIISDSWLDLDLFRESTGDQLSVSISNDMVNYKTIWNATGVGNIRISHLNLSQKFDIYSDYPSGLITPFGHYDFYLKIDMNAKSSISSIGVNELNLTVITQNNYFVLPQLWPVSNIIKITGNVYEDTSLRVTYNWNDLKGARLNQVIVEDTPFEYQIMADGTSWNDVVCNNLTVEALPRIGEGNKVVIKEGIPNNLIDVLPEDEFKTIDIVGQWYPPALKTSQEYINDIQSALAKGNSITSNDFTSSSNGIDWALRGLMVLRDPSAEQAIKEVIYFDKSYKYFTKYYALQALYLTMGEDSIGTMIDILEKDPKITGWNDISGEWNEDTIWLWECQIAAFILADINNTQARNNVFLISDLLNTTRLRERLGYSPSNIYKWSEIRWGLIKDIGILGGASEVDLLIDEIDDQWTGDNAALAAKALGDLGKTKPELVVPELLDLIQRTEAQGESRLKILYSIESLGKLGNASIAPDFYHYLNDWDEDFRGYTAKALGGMGNKAAIPYLQNLLQKETFSWVIEAAQTSITQLQEASTCTSGADTNPTDNIVSMTELMSYIADWKAGSITMTKLMDTIDEWKNGC